MARVLSPHAEDEERELARSFLASAGMTELPTQHEEASSLKRKAADFVARAANFVGHDEALGRVERVERAEKNAKKK